MLWSLLIIAKLTAMMHVLHVMSANEEHFTLEEADAQRSSISSPSRNLPMSSLFLTPPTSAKSVKGLSHKHVKRKAKVGLEFNYGNRGLRKMVFISDKVANMNLTANKIEYLGENDVENLYQITNTLDFSHNLISNIHPHAFCNQKLDCTHNKLNFLNLDHNQLTKFPPLKLFHLRELRLSNNFISRIQSKVFEGYHHLETLNVDNNENLNTCDLLTQSLLPVGRTLKYLHASHTDGVGFCTVKMSHFKDLQHLSVDFTDFRPLFTGKNHLKTLSMRGCGFKDGDEIGAQLHNLHSLHKLDLGSNSLTSFPDLPRTLRGSLKELRLFGNHIKWMGKTVLEGYKRLQVLDLSSNQLKYLDNIPRFVELHSLYLQHNEINFITKKFVQNLPTIEKLDLTKNKFFCDCRFRIILDIIRRKVYPQKLKKALVIEETPCALPEETTKINEVQYTNWCLPDMLVPTTTRPPQQQPYKQESHKHRKYKGIKDHVQDEIKSEENQEKKGLALDEQQETRTEVGNSTWSVLKQEGNLTKTDGSDTNDYDTALEKLNGLMVEMLKGKVPEEMILPVVVTATAAAALVCLCCLGWCVVRRRNAVARKTYSGNVQERQKLLSSRSTNAQSFTPSIQGTLSRSRSSNASQSNSYGQFMLNRYTMQCSTSPVAEPVKSTVPHLIPPPPSPEEMSPPKIQTSESSRTPQSSVTNASTLSYRGSQMSSHSSENPGQTIQRYLQMDAFQKSFSSMELPQTSHTSWQKPGVQSDMALGSCAQAVAHVAGSGTGSTHTYAVQNNSLSRTGGGEPRFQQVHFEPSQQPSKKRNVTFKPYGRASYPHKSSEEVVLKE